MDHRDNPALLDRAENNCPMTQCIVNILNHSFTQGIIPSEWTNSILVPVEKKGDMADPSNYRGISLMPSILKVLLMILNKRIQEYMEDNNLYSKEQAGFWTKEESTLQAACVIDILQRRKLQGKRTYCLFVDFEKAYDQVPHGLLTELLHNYGIRGRINKYIRRLYEKSTFQVRVSGGEEALYTSICELLRGLRQGCPLSLILFNIFINNIYEWNNGNGIVKPGVMVPLTEEGPS